MNSWKFGAVVLSVVAVAAAGCGSSESTSTTTSGTGGSKETTSTSTGGGAGGNGGASSTGTLATTGTSMTTTTTGTSMTTGTASTTATGTSTSSGTSTSTGMTTSSTSSTSTGGGATCANAMDCSLCKAKDKTCVECCGKANPAAQSKLIGFVIADCICPSASPCFTQCGGMGNTMPTVCTDPTTVSQPCAACVNGLGMNACVAKASQSCAADAVCKQIGVCQNSCAGM